MTRRTRCLLAAALFASPAMAQDPPLPVAAPPTEAPTALPATALRPIPLSEQQAIVPVANVAPQPVSQPVPQPALLERPYEAFPQPNLGPMAERPNATLNVPPPPPAMPWIEKSAGPAWRWYGWGAAHPVPPVPGVTGPVQPEPVKPAEAPKKEEKKEEKKPGVLLPPSPMPMTVLPAPVPADVFRPATNEVKPGLDMRLESAPKPVAAPAVTADPFAGPSGASATPTWKTARASSGR